MPENQAPKPPPPPDPDLVVVLPDGGVVKLSKPNIYIGVDVYRIAMQWLPTGAATGFPRGMLATIKALLYVTELRGEPVTRPGDGIQARELANRIGEGNTDRVADAWTAHFLTESGPSLPL